MELYHASCSELFEAIDVSWEQMEKECYDLMASTDLKAQYLVVLQKAVCLDFGISNPSSPLTANNLTTASLKSTGEASSVLHFLEQFLDLRPQLAVTRFLPSIVRFYEVLSVVVDGRFSLEELKTLTLDELLVALSTRSLETPDAINCLRGLIQQFLRHSRIYRALIPPLRGCGEAIKLRIFEFEIHELSMSTPLCYLLNINLGPEFHDSPSDNIRSMANRLVELHNRVLLARDGINSISPQNLDKAVDSSARSCWNAHQRLYKPVSNVSSQLSVLKHSASNFESSFALISGDLDFAGGTCEENLSDLQLNLSAVSRLHANITSLCHEEYAQNAEGSSVRQLVIDWHQVAEYIASVETAGRNLFCDLATIPVNPIAASRDQTTTLATNIDGSNNISLDYVSEIEKIAQHFHDAFPDDFEHLNPRHTFKCLRISHSKLQDLCRHLYYIIYSFIRRVNVVKEKPVTAEQISSTLHSSSSLPTAMQEINCTIEHLERLADLHSFDFEQRPRIFSLTGRHLYHLALYLAEYHREYRFWYLDQRFAPYEADFDSAAEEFILSLSNNLLFIANQITESQAEPLSDTSAEIPQKLDKIQVLQDSLNRLTASLSSDTFLRQLFQTPPGHSLRDIARETAVSCAYPTLVDLVIPETATISHLTTYLRKMALIINQTKSRHLQESHASQMDPPFAYQELVPEHFMSHQRRVKNVYAQEIPNIIDFGPIESSPTPLEQMMAEFNGAALQSEPRSHLMTSSLPFTSERANSTALNPLEDSNHDISEAPPVLPFASSDPLMSSAAHLHPSAPVQGKSVHLTFESIVSTWRSEMSDTTGVGATLVNSRWKDEFEALDELYLTGEEALEAFKTECDDVRLDLDGKGTSQLHLALRLAHSPLIKALVEDLTSNSCQLKFTDLVSQRSSALANEMLQTPSRLAISFVNFALQSGATSELIAEMMSRMSLIPIIIASSDEMVAEAFKTLCKAQFIPRSLYQQLLKNHLAILKSTGHINLYKWQGD